MIGLSVYLPGCKPPAPERFGFVDLSAALALAKQWVSRGAVVDVWEYVSGGPHRLVQRLQPEESAPCASRE